MILGVPILKHFRVTNGHSKAVYFIAMLLEYTKSVLQIRRGNRDNLMIISHISP